MLPSLLTLRTLTAGLVFGGGKNGPVPAGLATVQHSTNCSLVPRFTRTVFAP